MLSALERRVAAQLQLAPRGSVASFASNLGEAEHVVRGAFDRMTRSGALNVFAIVDPSAFGRPLVAGFRIRVEGERDVVVKSLQERPEIHWLTVVDDAQTILATANFADVQEINAYTETVVRTTAGIRDCVLHLYLEFEPVAYFSEKSARPRVRPSIDRARTSVLDDMDLRLLREFLQDARISYARAGKNVGLSLSAARQRVMRLEENGALRFHVLPNPFALGLLAPAMVSVKTSGTHGSIKEALLQLSCTTFLAETTGEYGLLVELFAENRSSLETHLQSVLKVPGVQDIQVDIYSEVIRDTGTWSP